MDRSCRLRRWLGVLAALALALRVLVPTGYMLAAVHGRAQLVLCPAGLHQGAHRHHGAGAVHQASAMELALLHGHAAGFAHAAEQCPFALAGGAGLAGAVPEPAQASFVLLMPVRTAALATVPVPPPPRHQAPRGPPALV
jgi:hypothetical protein